MLVKCESCKLNNFPVYKVILELTKYALTIRFCCSISNHLVIYVYPRMFYARPPGKAKPFVKMVTSKHLVNTAIIIRMVSIENPGSESLKFY